MLRSIIIFFCLSWLPVAGGCDAGSADAVGPPRPRSHDGGSDAPVARGDDPPPDGFAHEDRFHRELVSSALPWLQNVVRNEVVVDAVLLANKTNRLTHEEILARDRRWREARSVDDPVVRPYLTNDCARFLRAIRREHAGCVEIFVMDAKGCIVAASEMTSDFWQGDEDKWIRSFNGGDGEVFADEIDYDESTRAFVVQISLPVHDGAGATIGALTASVIVR